MRIEFGERQSDRGQLMVRVDGRARVAGEMFPAAPHTLRLQPVIERARIADDLRHIVAVAAPAQGVVRLVVEGNVQHRAEIEIEPEDAQQPPGGAPVPADQFHVAPVAELVRVRRLTPQQPQPRYAPALLVDGDDRLDLREIAQVVDELPQLRGRLDIPPEEDERTGLYPAEGRGGGGIEHRARDAGHEELAERRGHGPIKRNAARIVQRPLMGHGRIDAEQDDGGFSK